ncbi:MAG: lipid A deacylase LpxR family protein [Pseudomonadota bacterium]
MSFFVHPAAAASTANDLGPTVSLLVENDYFAKGNDDRNFTNGVQAQWIARPGRGPSVLHDIGRFLSPDEANAETRAVYGFGQRIYTPDIITTAIPDPNDRPYGAFLYGSFGVLANTNDRQLDAFSLTIGLTGPNAQGDEIQRFVHRATGARPPRGWDAQIDDGFAFEMEWRRIYRRKVWGEDQGWSADILPHAVARIGNLTTEAGLGGTLRVGRNIPIDFGPPNTRPGAPGSGYQRPVASFGWYVFGGVTGRYVARNLFLDEPSALGESVTREPFTGECVAGLAFNIDGVQIAYTHVWRAQEFEEEIGASKIGALSLTVNF